MHRYALSITLAFGGIRGSPIVVVRAQGWAVPGSLLQHLGDGRVIEVETVFDRVAASVEPTMQSDSAVSMARNFFSPAVGFINDRFQFLDRQRRLRNQFAVFSHPGAMGHVDLDPVGAMGQLLAGGFARFDGAVDELCTRGNLSRARSPRAGSRQWWKSRESTRRAGPGNVSTLDGFFDADVSVACSFGLQVAHRSEALLQRTPH